MRDRRVRFAVYEMGLKSCHFRSHLIVVEADADTIRTCELINDTSYEWNRLTCVRYQACAMKPRSTHSLNMNEHKNNVLTDTSSVITLYAIALCTWEHVLFLNIF